MIDIVNLFNTFLFFVCITYIVYRMLKNKKIPTNNYTPFDDLVNGNKPDENQEKILVDSKHETDYEEKTKI